MGRRPDAGHDMTTALDVHPAGQRSLPHWLLLGALAAVLVALGTSRRGGCCSTVNASRASAARSRRSPTPLCSSSSSTWSRASRSARSRPCSPRRRSCSILGGPRPGPRRRPRVGGARLRHRPLRRAAPPALNRERPLRGPGRVCDGGASSRWPSCASYPPATSRSQTSPTGGRGIPLPDYLLGDALGLLPVLLALTVVSTPRRRPRARRPLHLNLVLRKLKVIRL
jgi:hypothetical protein